MYIEINDNTKFKEIQEVFSDFYPFLLIEFYTKKHIKYESSMDIDLVLTDTIVSDVKKTHVSALLEILPLNKVADVEKEFQQRFGLSAQIFWKNKDVWQETTDLDDLTLKELTEMARNSSDEQILNEYEERRRRT